MDLKNKILENITEFYFDSRDFNGYPIRYFSTNLKISESEFKTGLISLIQDKMISLNFGDIHPNPHVKAFLEENEETQIEKLQKSNLEHVCAYPTSFYLEQVVDTAKYYDKPFTMRIALGEPTLSYLSFDLSILEFYRNDPRYLYYNNDISGRISVSDEYYESEKMAMSDQIILQTFGFSYDSDFNRAVAVFLKYLSKLSPSHQQIWNSKLLKGDYKLHPDYYRMSMGNFPEGGSIFDAFSEELHHINEMCKLMKRPNLFKTELSPKPRDFSFLIRPTLKEYNNFIHLLDKTISENINRKFFLNDIPFQYEDVLKDGKIVIRQKGTISILHEWLKKKFIPEDEKPMEEMISTFKEIRKLRQRPGHAIDNDVFDQKYFKMQRELIIRAYSGIRLIRLIFTNDQNVRDYKIPDWLMSDDKIRTF